MSQGNESVFNKALYQRLVEAIKQENIEALVECSSEVVGEIQTNGRDALNCEERVFDHYLEQHSIHVSATSVSIGLAMGLGEIVLRALAMAGLMQDLGMTQIDASIMKKNCALSDDEYEQIKKHPAITLDMIDGVPGVLPMVKTAILHHHENVNGTGYPDGLAEEEIPILARILHVADVFDAITTVKPYAKGLSKEDALFYLDGGKTLLFDEKVVNAFLESMSIKYPSEKVDSVSEDAASASVVSDALVEASSVQAEDKASGSILPPTSKKKILIVDDVYVSILHTTRALGDDYEVVSCLGGKNALVMVKAENPDLILMDYEMPDMDGATTVLKLRKAGYTMPVIFLTGKSDRETVVACGRTGAVDYVLKPANSVYLRTRLERVFQQMYYN